MKKINKEGRNLENIAYTLCCFVDLDGHTTEDAVRRRLKQLKLREPIIIQTSQGHFHIKFYLEYAVNAESSKQVNMWERVQIGLHKAFEDLGSDLIVVLDRTRLLHNEFAENIINRKHRNYFEVKTIDWGTGWHSLSELYRKLAQAGFIKKPAPTRDKSRWKHMDIQAQKVHLYFKNNPNPTCKQEESARRAGVPLRTFKHVLKVMREKRLFSEPTCGGKGEDRRVIRRFLPVPHVNLIRKKIKVHKVLKDYKDLNTTEENTPDYECNMYERIIFTFNRTVFPKGIRNRALYIASVALKSLTRGLITIEKALEMLSGGIHMNIRNDFDMHEITWTIKSGLKSTRGFVFSSVTLEMVGYE